MEEIKGHDRWLDPPDPPTHAECDKCGAWCDIDDLHQIKGAGSYGDDLWICDDCFETMVDDQSLHQDTENEF